MENVRIYEMPTCKMFSSGIGMFGEDKFEKFSEWFSSLKRGLFPKDFLFWEETGFHWVYMYENDMDVTEEFEITDFQGGLYAVATGMDQRTDRESMNKEVDVFLEKTVLCAISLVRN